MDMYVKVMEEMELREELEQQILWAKARKCPLTGIFQKVTLGWNN